MAEMILPGTYIEVRPEGLIVPGQITVGNLGVVGTAAKGEINKPILLGSFAEAKQHFYDYDSWIDPSTLKKRTDELTLVRALEQAFRYGATTVYAVRVAAASASEATYTLKSQSGDCVKLAAKFKGTWGNDLTLDIGAAEENAFIADESVPISGLGALTLKRKIAQSPRNRISVDRGGVVTPLNIIYAGTPQGGKNQVRVDLATRLLSFAAGEGPTGTDTLTASYVVLKADAKKVTLHLGRAEEIYTIVDGNNLVDEINSASAWVDATALANANEPPKDIPSDAPASLRGGADGASGADYTQGLDQLLNVNAHIIVAAGQDFGTVGNKLDAHCQKASTDAFKRDRIAVTGSGTLADPNRPLADPSKSHPDPDVINETLLDQILGHNLDSDRVILITPGMQTSDTSADPPVEVMLSAAYTAAATAGLLASYPAHISLTNKTLSVDELEQHFTTAQLTQLDESRVLALEKHQGFRVVKGITTTTGSAFAQITTRRIVDFAKFGTRSAATPYIGLLNNERVRGALRATINSFLDEMVKDEMLISYDLSVTATRDDEIKGIARVTMTLRPVFSIDFIKVTMFLG